MSLQKQKQRKNKELTIRIRELNSILAKMCGSDTFKAKQDIRIEHKSSRTNNNPLPA
jgi:hypothetical protein